LVRAQDDEVRASGTGTHQDDACRIPLLHDPGTPEARHLRHLPQLGNQANTRSRVPPEWLVRSNRAHDGEFGCVRPTKYDRLIECGAPGW
jgi:hypothetical protein